MAKYIAFIFFLYSFFICSDSLASHGLPQGDSLLDLNVQCFLDEFEAPERSPTPDPEELSEAKTGVLAKDPSFSRRAYLCPLSGKVISRSQGESLTIKRILSIHGATFNDMTKNCRSGEGLESFRRDLIAYPELSNHASIGGFTLLYFLIRNCRDNGDLKLFNNMDTRLEMMRALFKAGADPNIEIFTSKDVYESLLTLACRVGNAKMVTMLIHAGADMSYQDDQDLTPLHHAVANRTHSLEIIRTLLNKGADTTIKCEMNCTPLELAYHENFAVTDREGVASVFKEWSDKK